MTGDEGRIAEEKKTIEIMIHYYCDRKHESKSLCQDCEELLRYAHSRLNHCRYGNDKPTCRRCDIHCYSPVYRAKIKAVMRFAGPRMLFTVPIRWIKHKLHDRD